MSWLSWVVKTAPQDEGPLQEEEGEDAAIEASNAQCGAPLHVAHCTGGEEVQDCFWRGLGKDWQLWGQKRVRKSDKVGLFWKRRPGLTWRQD